MKDDEQELKLELQCSSIGIAEIADDNAEWSEEGIVQIDAEQIAEITKGDDKPFFVEFVALYEGMSANSRNYTDDAVKSCVPAMIGVNMYKGHVEPGTANWKYREPVGRVVAAKLGRIDIPGRKGVLCAKGKAYITEADPKLRADIAKRMAGSVSILGNARSVRKLGDSKRDVIKLHKPLDSVDFCNPGTGGLKHAGVTAVVAEMSGQEIETVENIQETEKEKTMPTKLTREELLAQYAPEITALVGEQIDGQVAEINTGRRDLAQSKEDFKDEKTVLEGKVAEMTTKVTDLETKNADLQKLLDTERDARLGAELKVFADGHIAEMKNLDGANVKLIDMAAKDTSYDVIDGDLEKSKDTFKTALTGNLEKLGKIAEMFGGDEGNKPNTQTKSHSKNPGKKDKSALSRIMSPELAEAHTKRVGTAS